MQRRRHSAYSALEQYRDLLIAWTTRTVQARYKQSLLGILWAVVQPAAKVLVFTIIFTRVVPVDTGSTPYAVFSYTAMAPWLFFSMSISDMVASLTTNINLVTKIYFPREVLPIAASLARLLDFVIAFGLLVVLMFFYNMPVFTSAWLYIPLVVLVQLALTAGIGLIGAAMNVFYRDIKHLFEFGLQLWFYATPIIYPVTLIPETYRPLYYLNPMAGVIEAYRAVLLEQSAPGGYFWISVVTAAVILVIGFGFFKRVEFQFADVV